MERKKRKIGKKEDRTQKESLDKKKGHRRRWKSMDEVLELDLLVRW